MARKQRSVSYPESNIELYLGVRGIIDQREAVSCPDVLGQGSIAMEALGQDHPAFLLTSEAAHVQGLEGLDGDGVDAFVGQSFRQTL